MKKTKFINLIGGPGSGKSSMMLYVAGKLKLMGVSLEHAPEYVKKAVYEGRHGLFGNQLKIFAMQHDIITVANGQVDVVITDSPLLLSIYYSQGKSKALENLILEEHLKLNNFNVFVNRVKKYDTTGRYQNEEEAGKVCVELKEMMAKLAEDSNGDTQFNYIELDGNIEGGDKLTSMILNMIGR